MNPLPNRELMLEDYMGEAIPNCIGADPDAAVVARQQRGIRGITGFKRELTLATGRYNCYGHVFASRRTFLAEFETPDLERILRNDQFSPATKPQVGDIVVYWSGPRTLVHVGFVSWVDDQLGQVRIWSKWGSLGEYEHHVHAHPYWKMYTDIRVEYWRLS